MQVEIVSEIDANHKIIKYTFENVSDEIDPDNIDIDNTYLEE